MALEYELKYLRPDLDALRSALEAARGQWLAGPYFEENLVFDFEDRSLKAQGVLLRLRRKGGQDAVLTVKRPSGADAASVLKVFEESQTATSDFDATRLVLEALGYAVAFRYEKVREKWRLGEVVVCMDSLPFGVFVELEGPEPAVPAAAAALGLEALETSKVTYHELNQIFRSDNGLVEDESFVFDPARRKEIIAAL